MPLTYDRPSFDELKTRIAADIAAAPAVIRAPLAAMLAKTTNGLHGHLDWIARQLSPATCDVEWLHIWATLYHVLRLGETKATGSARATGSLGATVLAASLLRGTNDIDYEVLAAQTVGASLGVVCDVRATTAGEIGNLTAGQVLTFVDPLSGIASTATVDVAGLTGGAAEETIDAWRARVVDEWQTVVTEGARSGKRRDYVFWARAAHPSVTSALVAVHTLGVGTVVVRPICNSLPNRLPSAAVMAAVDAYLQEQEPATAEVYTSVPVVRTVNVSLQLASAVDTAQNRASITAALQSSVNAERDEGAQWLLAEIDAAVGTVTSQYTRITPTANVNLSATEVLVLGAVTFV